MSSRGRARGLGTGRGRGTRSTAPGEPARPPNPETLARIGFSVENEDKGQTGQFDSAEELDERNEASTDSEGSVIPQAAPIEGNESNVEAQAVESESSLNPQSPEFSPTSETTKLNPSAPVFSPTSTKPSLSPASSTTSSKLNPTTPEFFPTGVNGNYSNTTHSSTTARVNNYTLNPQSRDFVSKSVSPMTIASSLNVSAPAFVPQAPLPTVMQNGRLDDKKETESSVNEGVFDEEELLALTPNDIINEVKYPCDDMKTDVGGESLLKAAAEMLIKSTIYPASFDRWKLRLEHTVKAWAPEINSLTNLAEMLIHWGINEPGLRLTSCRICQALNDMNDEHVKGNFNKQIVLRLQDWFKKRDKTEKDQLVDFSLFFAELFSRLRMTDQETPIRILGNAVLALLRQLLDEVHEKSIIGACHIIKLTGPLLDGVQKEGDTNFLDEIFKTLERLSTDQTLPLSSKCVEIIVRVIELRAREWGQAAAPLSTSPPAPTTLSQYLLGPGVTQEESNAGEITSDLSSFQSAFQFQAPVSNPEEWNEFLDEDNDLIEDDDSPTDEGYVIAPECEQEDEIDAEMRKEFEYFVQDLEDHLLNMGEMDPEQFQEEQ